MENTARETLPVSTCSMQSALLRDFQPFWITHFAIAVNTVLFITAILGNMLILVALQNSHLHPPSKLLFRCLASTDLCAGPISQPCFVIYLTSEIMQALSVCHVAQRLLHISSTTL